MKNLKKKFRFLIVKLKFYTNSTKTSENHKISSENWQNSEKPGGKLQIFNGLNSSFGLETQWNYEINLFWELIEL